MIVGELPERLETLVDYLRTHKNRTVSLTEIASVTEVLIGTMSTYFGTIDTSMYREFRYLSEFITRARDEISQLHPAELKTRQIPRAGRELDAIVAATEEATNTIMEAAETIMAADPSDADEYANTVNECVMSIFEACSFQDITGQRISKVVETLSVIETRLHRIGEVWGVEGEAAAEEESESSVDNPGMSGPALAGEGVDQQGADALMSGDESGHTGSAQDAVDDLFNAVPAETADEMMVSDIAEPETAQPETAAAPVPETDLSDEDVERLMGTEAEDRGDDYRPPVEPDNRTAEELVQAVESLLQEEADEAEAQAVRATSQELNKVEELKLPEPTNDDQALYAEPHQKAAQQSAHAGGGAKKTTQADIDALFS